jgi:hypothetical protein
LLEVLNLGLQPIANALVEERDLSKPEPMFPLAILFCTACALLQIGETIPPEILFGQNYPYFSSFLPALVAHNREHAQDLIAERKLGATDLVVEVASNDGYLLKNFVAAKVPVLGIDPAEGPVKAAIEIGVPTMKAFFGEKVARELVAEGKRASVMLANNVLAHVTDINDFVKGFAILLSDDGIAEFEFPHVKNMVQQCAFDQIYHEHVFYYSLTALEPLFNRHGLHLNDASENFIHGGSLRLRVSKTPGKSERLIALQEEEARLGMGTVQYFDTFAARVSAIRYNLRTMLEDIVAKKKTIAGYGAAAKAATLLNYVQLPEGTISFIVDRNPHKVGKYLPGVHLPIRDVSELTSSKPDYVLIMTWNFADEIMAQQQAYTQAGGAFVLAVPEPRIVAPTRQASNIS